MGCTDSRLDVKKMGTKTEGMTREDTETTPGTLTGDSSRTYKVADLAFEHELMKNLAENWVSLHKKVDQKALPLYDDDEEPGSDQDDKEEDDEGSEEGEEAEDGEENEEEEGEEAEGSEQQDDRIEEDEAEDQEDSQDIEEDQEEDAEDQEEDDPPSDSSPPPTKKPSRR